MTLGDLYGVDDYILPFIFSWWRVSGWPRLRVQHTLYPPKWVKPSSHEFSLAPALKQLVWEERRGLLKTEEPRKKIAQTRQIAINFFLKPKTQKSAH